MLGNFNEFPDWISRGLDDLFPYKKAEDSDQSFLKRLELSSIEKKPLRVKLGIDPTGTEIHIGHSILFRKLRAFQDAGHKAILIIGDFTARIGDPTGKSKTRIQLTKDEVESNALNYLEQLGLGKEPQNSLLDFSTPGRLEIRRNSEWLENLNLSNVIELLSNSTVGQMLAKEDFNNRYKSGTPISLHEFLYPLLQGYDSVAINADLELGGTDQKFNIAMGRDLQKAFGQKPQFGMLLPILVGLDGTQKMSKSLNNFVGINEDSLSMYSKLEKVPDDLVFSYLNLLTDENLNELSSIPREVQKFMALKITSNFKGLEAAKKAQYNSEKLILGNQNSLEEIPESSISKVNFPAKAFYLFSKMKLCSSSSEARRQILGGGVRIDGEKIEDPNLEFDTPNELIGKILQVGKKKFLRVSN
ncbi:tyrosine--tRNA ligase [Prochlorococcus sp. MIT 1011]|uniref:tyrosine--tRNA ligase n=1 Tax=Prochlorococcus sp. MIT 1011 TaxID=3082520 RepID=UPI0039B47337